MTQDKPTVAYLGPEGTYSEEAARAFFGDRASFSHFASIDETIQAVENGQADTAVVPIENSTEGAINSTYNHLLETPLLICGEILLPIHHQLLSNAGSLDKIHQVIAHPQTLAQCRVWLQTHLPDATQIPSTSNAEAARQATTTPDMAAIAGNQAGIIYGLPVLQADIQDDPSNTTRFIVLGKAIPPPIGKDKTSLVCSTPDKPGALYKVLGVLAEHGVNMVKLESRPMRGTLHDYIFYIDIEGHQHDPKIAEALKEIKLFTTFLKPLGSYPAGA